MSKEKTPDDKLREAAEHQIPLNERSDENATKWMRRGFVMGAMSKEAAEYHQSLQPVVDVSKLWGEFIDFVWFENNNTSAGKIFDFFKPHLQPPAPESDAVDFANYINKRMYAKYGDNWTDGKNVFSTEYIYNTDYKQSKTNSDEQDKK